MLEASGRIVVLAGYKSWRSDAEEFYRRASATGRERSGKNKRCHWILCGHYLPCEIITARSFGVVPKTKRDLTRRSRETEGSPASIFATLD